MSGERAWRASALDWKAKYEATLVVIERVRTLADDWDEFPDDELGVEEAVPAIRAALDGVPE